MPVLPIYRQVCHLMRMPALECQRMLALECLLLFSFFKCGMTQIGDIKQKEIIIIIIIINR